MKQKTINLYTFEELTEEQKAKVLDRYRDFNDDVIHCYANDEFCMGEIWESGFTDAQPCYDLSYCQGDGACFDCSEFDFDLLLKEWNYPHKQWFIDIIKAHYQGYIKKNNYGYHYSHSKTRYFELSSDGVLDWHYCSHINKAIYLAEKHIENLRYELSENLTSRLYNQLEWLRDDEQIADTLIANEYYFNGETLEIEN